MKKNQLIGIILASIGLSMAVVGSSHASQGIYVNSNVAFSILPTLNYISADHIHFMNVQNKHGLGVGGAVGYQYDNYRIEGAYDYFINKTKNATTDFFSPATKNDAGKIKAGVTMVNGLYDLDAISDWTTYLGVGLGVVHVLHSITIDANDSSHGSITKFAYQGILGASYRLSDFVRTNVDYRYLRSTASYFDVMDGPLPLIPMKAKFKDHRITLSLSAFL